MNVNPDIPRSHVIPIGLPIEGILRKRPIPRLTCCQRVNRFVLALILTLFSAGFALIGSRVPNLWKEVWHGRRVRHINTKTVKQAKEAVVIPQADIESLTKIENTATFPRIKADKNRSDLPIVHDPATNKPKMKYDAVKKKERVQRISHESHIPKTSKIAALDEELKTLHDSLSKEYDEHAAFEWARVMTKFRMSIFPKSILTDLRLNLPNSFRDKVPVAAVKEEYRKKYADNPYALKFIHKYIEVYFGCSDIAKAEAEAKKIALDLSKAVHGKVSFEELGLVMIFDQEPNAMGDSGKSAWANDLEIVHEIFETKLLIHKDLETEARFDQTICSKIRNQTFATLNALVTQRDSKVSSLKELIEKTYKELTSRENSAEESTKKNSIQRQCNAIYDRVVAELKRGDLDTFGQKKIDVASIIIETTDKVLNAIRDKARKQKNNPEDAIQIFVSYPEQMISYAHNLFDVWENNPYRKGQGT